MPGLTRAVEVIQTAMLKLIIGVVAGAVVVGAIIGGFVLLALSGGISRRHNP